MVTGNFTENILVSNSFATGHFRRFHRNTVLSKAISPIAVSPKLQKNSPHDIFSEESFVENCLAENAVLPKSRQSDEITSCPRSSPLAFGSFSTFSDDFESKICLFSKKNNWENLIYNSF